MAAPIRVKKEKKMKINHFVVGPVQTNCYFVINETTGETLVIDPGASAKALAQRARADQLKPVAVLLTHGHFDHAGGAEEFAREFDIPIYIHEQERDTLTDPEINASWMMGRQEVYHADHFLKDEQEIDLAGFHIRVLLTPGHTPGGCCYYFPYNEVLFSGDSLFCGSIGRTDFKKGNMAQLVRAIKEKIMVLPDRTTVYPGHNDITSIEHERAYNYYLI